MPLREPRFSVPASPFMPGTQEPIRSDLWSPERLEEHAEEIARQRVMVR